MSVVTGASRGIGRSTALALAASGLHVVLAARSEIALAEAQSTIHARGGRAGPAVRCDVGDHADVESLFIAAGEIGTIRSLVCAAGVLLKGFVEDLAVDEWEGSIRVNLTGTFLCCQQAFRAMKTAGSGGCIVTIRRCIGGVRHREVARTGWLQCFEEWDRQD